MSWVLRPTTAEQAPAVTVCAAEVNASTAGAAGLIVSTFVPGNSPGALVETVGVPAVVSRN